MGNYNYFNMYTNSNRIRKVIFLIILLLSTVFLFLEVIEGDLTYNRNSILRACLITYPLLAFIIASIYTIFKRKRGYSNWLFHLEFTFYNALTAIYMIHIILLVANGILIILKM